MSAPDEEVSEPMSPALFPARSSVLADAALADYAAHAFALDPPVACLFFQWDDNDTHLVTAGDGIQRFLRVSRLGKRSLAAAEAEAEIVARLADAGVPVARPIRRRDGRYSQELLAAKGPRPIVLFAAALGATPFLDITAELARSYGRVVAQIHEALDGLDGNFPRPVMQLPFLLDTPLDRILPWLRHRPEDARDLLAVADAVREQVGALPTTAPAYGLCHGDLHKRNVLDDGNGRLTVLDWDCLGYGWRAYDLAVLAWSIGPAVGPQGIGEPRMMAVWEAYLHGYQECRMLSDAELAAIPAFVAARQIWNMAVEIEGAERGRFGLSLLTERFWDNRMAKLRSCPYVRP